ncbi:AAA family ATPase [Rhodobacteraceae bacterium HSP-20]|uniref:AAA family ATPase n=1 Tax=Paragemmobacter amnigenus TaxID=2852097 RepID=A0ABS6JAE1_9RHOB|nr:AAA family ATPase [Rhodobacter amnigenus]MBU9699330.1 AAA family ATPase [Rhodobacter amnigenus]MBV4390557.1 AAA family ATPase [Rhodobacter amnigenus]
MPLLLVVRALLEASRMSDNGILHFNPWMDFNDGPPSENPFGCDPDPGQIAVFLDTVFSWCEGLIPLRGFVDKGQGRDGKPHNIWIPADDTAPGKLATFAAWANREGAAVYVIPGTVAEQGQARAADVLQMQAIVVDLDAGDIPAKLDHVTRHLGAPTLIIESGGRTPEGAAKLHVWWKLTEPAEGEELATLCRLRGEIAVKVGGDTHFRSAHQPIRVPGTVYHKHGHQRLVQIREHRDVEVDLADFAERAAEMPPLPGVGFASDVAAPTLKPGIDAVLTTPVREGSVDDWSRFQGASAAIGHYVRLVHEGRLDPFAGWEAICGYNAAMLRPSWPLDRLQAESERLWALHVKRNGPPLLRAAHVDAPASPLPTFSLGALLDDTSPMPEDIIGPRVLTPGGLLVLGGAPKVGKSDFLISWLVHMAAGVPFLGFTPPRPLRVFYLQAEIQYHYLRERTQQIALPAAVIAAARDTFIATPKLKLLLDAEGVARVAEAIRAAFPDAPPDIIVIDPIRNLFDGGPEGGGENDNTAMMFFLKDRVELLREAVNPDAGIILAHHTRKATKHQVKDDPFLALSGASALRGFYTSGLLMHRPDEDSTVRRLEIELRNGPALPGKLIDKVKGEWVELNPMNERLVRKEVGAKFDAERLRKHDVILGMLLDEAASERLYTAMQFAETFENRGGLGSKHTIRERLSVLATKGFVKFLRDPSGFGFPVTRSRFGYLCVEGMQFGAPVEEVDPDTGEVTTQARPVLPSHFKCPQSGLCLQVENPAVWVYPEGLEDDLTHMSEA